MLCIVDWQNKTASCTVQKVCLSMAVEKEKLKKWLNIYSCVWLTDPQVLSIYLSLVFLMTNLPTLELINGLDLKDEGAQWKHIQPLFVRINQNHFGLVVLVFTGRLLGRSSNFPDSEGFTETRRNIYIFWCPSVFLISSLLQIQQLVTKMVTLLVIPRKMYLHFSYGKNIQDKKMHVKYQHVPVSWSMLV